MSSSVLLYVYEAEYSSGETVLPVAYIVLCVRFVLLLPASTQHSI